MHRMRVLLVGCAMSSGVALAAEPEIAPALRCDALTGFSVPGSTMVIDRAVAEPAAPPGTVRIVPEAPDTVRVALPPNCRVASP